MPYCKKCSSEKPRTEFFKSSRRSNGLQSYCKPCGARANRESRSKDRDRYLEGLRKSNLKRYGISPGNYDSLLEAQGSVCASCKRENSTNRKMYVDHDHATGKIRGLLCHHCNFALGYARNDIRVLESLIDYLKANT